MKIRTLVLISAAALLLSGCVAMQGASTGGAPEPVRPVDAPSHFSGRWYEIGRTPMRLTDGCVAGYTDYVTRDGQLTQRDGCRDGAPSGKEKVIAGPLKILNPGQNNKVHVSYRLFGLIPVGRTYWLLDHGDGWFIMATDDFKLVNLYTRAPRPSAQLVDHMKERTRALGYDIQRLEFPTQFPPGEG